MRKAISLIAGLGVFSLASAAFAQGYGYSAGYSANYRMGMPPASGGQIDNIGNAGQLVFGAERLTGISFNRFGYNGGTGTSTSIGLLGPFSGENSVGSPRVGLDYFVIDSVSIGAGLWYAHDSGVSVAGGSGSGSHTFLFAPRVGYAYAFDDTFSVWPRAGITYVSQTGGHYLDLTLEGLFGISPVSHLVILGGPFADLGLSGSQNAGAGSQDAKQTGFGLTFGLAGYI
jgi:hypothetical protein